jgi:hypothetical protein
MLDANEIPYALFENDVRDSWRVLPPHPTNRLNDFAKRDEVAAKEPIRFLAE